MSTSPKISRAAAMSPSPVFGERELMSQQQAAATPHKNEHTTSIDQVPLSNGKSSLYRAPTWARNINFDNGFDPQLDGRGPEGKAGPSTRHTPNGSSGSSAMAMMGVALSGGSEAGAGPVEHARMGSTVDTKEGEVPGVRNVSTSSTGSRGPAPSGMILSHQRVASSHTIESATANSTARNNRYHEPPRSSADLYAMPSHPPPTMHAQPFEHLQHLNASGPGTSEGADADPSIAKRGSVLSFQTAVSGNNMGFGSNASNNDDDNSIERLNDGPPVKPWMPHVEAGMRSGPSSFSSSPDDRNVPGGWANRGMDDLATSPRGKSPMRHPQLRSHASSPRMQLLPLGNSSSERMAPSPTLTPSQLTTPVTPSQSRVQRESSSASSQGRMSPTIEKSLPSKPSTSRSSSRSPVMQRQPETEVAQPREESLPLLMSPSDSATILPAHEPRTSDGAAVPSTPSKASNLMGSSGSATAHTKPIPPAKDRELGVSSPPLSDDIIPTPLPVTEARPRNSSTGVINVPTSPISDFRAKPLAQLPQTATQHDPPSPYRETANGKRSPTATRKLVPGVGAHQTSGSTGDSAPAFAALMRNNSASNLLAAASTANLKDQSGDTLLDTQDSPSAETPPREPSPPPEGEVEARAEWERQQMRRMVEKSKQSSTTTRKTTFRGQLKPLQLVTADEAKQVPVPKSPGRTGDTSPKDARHDAAASPNGSRANLDLDGVPGKTVQTRKSGVLSTQQLQKQSARDQRRTASNLAMGVSEIGGAYPVFASPPLDPLFVGGTRQYRGVLPQRSLVPPFELQNRPDGLPSALIGPDGVRRNLNDPDICLECMMRDEDMIDVHVVGSGLWERESDREFDDACRIESERDTTGRADGSVSTHAGTLENSSSGIEGQARSDVALQSGRLTKIRVKRVAKGEPLTTERLKLHTQMNPPASSHRWRTLQFYLASQAKYIANEQRARGLLPQQPPVPAKAEQDPRIARAPSGESRKSLTAYPSLPRMDEKALPITDRQGKEAPTREARRRNASIGQSGDTGSPTSLAPRSRAPSNMFDMSIAEDVEEIDGAASPPARMLGNNNNSTGHQSIPRRNNAPPAAIARGGSAMDLRNVSNAMLKPTDGQTSPVNILPPSSSLRAPTPTAFGRSSRAASSQLSLAPSGSMIDMHVGGEDRREHRIAQAGFLPGSHFNTRSPSAFNRAYYGFPGDGEGDYSHDEGYGDPMDQTYLTIGNDISATDSFVEPEGDKKRKKASGLRGLFGKLAGKDTSSPVAEKKELRGEGERPFSPSDERPRRTSIGLDRLMDLQRPPQLSGLLSKARRSTSSLLQGGMPIGRPSIDSSMMLNGNDRLGAGVYTNPPGMTSQASFEMGPFGSGPMPPPRGESKGRGEDEPSGRPSFSIGRPSLSLRPDSALRQRAISATNLFRSSDKAAVGDASDLPVSSRAEASSSPIYERNRKASPAIAREYAQGQNAYNTPRQPANSYETPPRTSMSAPRTSMSAARTLDYDSGMARNDGGRGSGGNDALFSRPMRSPYRSPANARTLDAVADVENDTSYAGMPASSSRKSFLPSGRLSMQGMRNDAPQHPLAKNGNRHDSAFLRTAMDDSLAPSESFASTRSSAVGGPTTPTTPSTSRKSRFLKMAFGRNKRESNAPSSSAVAKQYTNGTSSDMPTLASRSSRGTMDDSFNSLPSHLRGPRRQSSHSQLSLPQSSGLRSFASRDVLSPTPFAAGIEEGDEFGQYGERPHDEQLGGALPPSKPWYMPGRRTSNQIEDRAAILGALPPRSHSALGMMDSSRFAMSSQDDLGRFDDGKNGKDTLPAKGRRGLLPRFRTSSRAALRAVNED